MLRTVHCPKAAISIQQREYIGSYMPFLVSAAARLDIAGVGLMPKPAEFDAYALTFLTGNQDAHIPFWLLLENTHLPKAAVSFALFNFPLALLALAGFYAGAA